MLCILTFLSVAQILGGGRHIMLHILTFLSVVQILEWWKAYYDMYFNFPFCSTNFGVVEGILCYIF